MLLKISKYLAIISVIVSLLLVILADSKIVVIRTVTIANGFKNEVPDKAPYNQGIVYYNKGHLPDYLNLGFNPLITGETHFSFDEYKSTLSNDDIVSLCRDKNLPISWSINVLALTVGLFMFTAIVFLNIYLLLVFFKALFDLLSGGGANKEKSQKSKNS